MDIDHLYLCRYNYHQKIHPIYKKPVGKFTTEYEKGSSEYYQNDLISCMLTLLKDVDNSINSLYKSIDNDTELPKRIADQIAEENSTKADPYNFGSLHELVLRKLDYITGKKGIGPFALNVTNQILCMLYDIEYLENHFTKEVGLTSIGRILDDEDNYVSSWLSGFINGHVDIVKDPWISKLNVNPYTYNMLNMLIRCGWGSVAVWLLSQPIIRDIALADILALSLYSRDVEKTSSQFKARQQAIKEALSEYMTDEEFSEEILFNIVSAQDDTERIFYVKWIKLHNDVLAEFAKNKHLEKVTVDGETYYRNEVQKYAFYAWKSLEPYAFALNNFIQHTKIDTRKHGNSMIAIAKYRQEYLDMIYPKGGRSIWNLSRLRRMVGRSWIHKKTINAISAPFSILGNYTFAGNEEFINTVLRFARTLADTNEELNFDTCKQISNNLITYIKSKYFVNYVQTVLCDEGQSADDYIRNLFVGNWNMNHRLNAMLYQIETNPQYKRLSTNTFINQIFAELLDEDIVVNGRVVLRPNFIVVRDNVNGSKINSDLLIRGWQDLLTDSDVHVRRFARDMIIYAFMSSGEFKGWGKIFEYVPPTFLLGQIDTNVQSFNDFIKELLVNLKIEDSALDDIVANNFMDYRFSRMVPLQDPTTKEYNFINVQDAILFGKYLKSDEDVKPYITVPTSNNAGKGVARYNVYKFVGFVRIDDENSSPVYVMMRKRGYHTLNKRDIYEYGWNFRYGENSYSDDFDTTNVALSISAIEDLFNGDGELSVSHDYLLRTFYNYGYDFQTESSSMEDRSIVTEFNDQQKDPFTLNEVTNTVQQQVQGESDTSNNNGVPASYEGMITPDTNTVFVFGSNPKGIHGAGAAATAKSKFGAIQGQGEGLQGNAYALPTKNLDKAKNTRWYRPGPKEEAEVKEWYKNHSFSEVQNHPLNAERTMTPQQIVEGIQKLYEAAHQNPDKQFKVSHYPFGKLSLNGYLGEEMLAMFKQAGKVPSNVQFNKEWTDHWNDDTFNVISQGENIASNGSEFAKKLTNPGNNLQVEYKGKTFRNAEHAYQTWKSGEFDEVAYNSTAFKPKGSKPVNKQTNYQTMVDILKAKLQQHPELVEGITQRGGEAYLKASTHKVTGDKYWESTGQNKFIEALTEAYNAINKLSISSISDKTEAYGVEISSGSQEFWKKVNNGWQTQHPQGLVAYRKHGDSPKTFSAETVKEGWIGNPFSTQTKGEKTVQQFYDWLVTGNNFGNERATEEFRQVIILKILNTPEGSPILYYTELNRPSHATVIGFLVNNKHLLSTINQGENSPHGFYHEQC